MNSKFEAARVHCVPAGAWATHAFRGVFQALESAPLAIHLFLTLGPRCLRRRTPPRFLVPTHRKQWPRKRHLSPHQFPVFTTQLEGSTQ